MDGLEIRIRDLIECIYKCCFTRPIKVEKKEDRYTVTLFLHDEHFGGTVLSNLCASDEEFLDFLAKELKARRLDRSHHFKLKVYANGQLETDTGVE